MKQYFCVGTYTEPILFGTGEVFTGKGEGIYLCSFENGKIQVINSISQRNPSFFCIDEKNQKIYTVNEMKEYLGEFGGGVTEITYNLKGEMREDKTYNTGGTDPCHIALSPNGRFLSVSNFANGSVSVFPVGDDGSVLPNKKVFNHEGDSIHPVRQKGPHAHSTVFSPSDNKMYVPDLGIDKLVCYSYNGMEVSSDPESTIDTYKGSGPRFGEFSSDGKHFYLINEIGSSVTHFLYDNGAMITKETVSTLPDDYTGENICSDLHISPNGKYLYASNRGHDSICVFSIGDDGGLSFIERQSCRGKTPRNFTITPDGEYMLIGNQDRDTFAVFKINTDGTLSFFDITDFPTPVCIRFFKETLFD